MAGGSCTEWSNLRQPGRIYDFRRYGDFLLRLKGFYDLQIGLATERLSNKNPISERVIANMQT